MLMASSRATEAAVQLGTLLGSGALHLIPSFLMLNMRVYGGCKLQDGELDRAVLCVLSLVLKALVFPQNMLDGSFCCP